MANDNWRDEDRQRWSHENRESRDQYGSEGRRQEYGRGGYEYGSYGRPADPRASESRNEEQRYGRDYEREPFGKYSSAPWNLDRHGEPGYGQYGERYGGQYSRPNAGQNVGENRGEYGGDYRRESGPERGWWDRTRDEFRAWLGDEQANQRRVRDGARDLAGGQYGRGPRNYTRSDSRILEDINDRLTDDWHVDASDIEVTVTAGEATLSGHVDSRDAKRRAEDVAANVSGVKDVQNNLRVRPRASLDTDSNYGSASSAAATSGNLGTASNGRPRNPGGSTPDKH